ncbi:hypothetical protein [Profundibacter sp.]
MRKLFLSLCMLTATSACFPTEQGYKNLVTSWIGSPERALIQKWGPPDSAYSSQGLKYITYNKQRSGYIPGTAPTYTSTVIGNTIYTNSYGGTQGYSYTESCKTTFTLQRNKIVDVSYKGNNCVALEE